MGQRNYSLDEYFIVEEMSEIRYEYVDGAIIAMPGGCGPPALSGDRLETVSNPVVIAEVLSESTRDYDRGQKFDLYRTISTLRDYLLIDQYAIDVEHRFLAGLRWDSKRYTKSEDSIQLSGIEVALSIGAMYELVDFSAAAQNQ